LLLTITTTQVTTTQGPATDLGYLLAKNPAKVQSFTLTFGRAHVFYPVATAERCTAALLLDVDPIRLSRRVDDSNAPLEPYVNDRPYVASSFLSVAIAEIFGTALSGRSRERQELAATAIPLEVCIESLPCRGGRALLDRLFEPLGYHVEAERLPLDPEFPSWGESAYHRVRLRGTAKVADLLAHLYVLIPVLDDEKHYWVGDDEVEKLLRRGEGWLASHPAREIIAERYLRHQKRLVRGALERLAVEEGEPVEEAARSDAGEEAIEKPLRLDLVRIQAVSETLRDLGASTVVDLGCGEGKLLRALMKDTAFTHILGVDVSLRALDVARERLGFDELPPKQKARLTIEQGSLTYRDARFSGFDAAALVEVIEHLDPSRLDALERVVFRHARPRAVVVTTPNAEYNALFASLPSGKLRHPDHRFEWTRAELREWASRVAGEHGYAVRFGSIGEEHPEHGPPTQMAIFELGGGAS
jgi:3' terminal RNA ribose 2'-O-methyltransferase Hen1